MFFDLSVFPVFLISCHVFGCICMGSEHLDGEKNAGLDAVERDCQSSMRSGVVTETCKAKGKGKPQPAVRLGSDERNTNMALVLYDESVISPFHIEKRTFNFGDIRVDISQDWKNAGVAAVVWDAAVVLGEYVEQHHALVENLSVLELGAGTGLAGIVAALVGGHVTITDRAIALDIIRENVNLNLKRVDSRDLEVAVRELEWGRDLHEWTPYRIVLGADIIYVEETFNDLLDTFVRVCDAHTVVLLSCKIRYARDRRFLTMMERHFTVTEVHFEKRRDIHIYRCIKR